MILVTFFDFFLILVIFGHFGPLGGLRGRGVTRGDAYCITKMITMGVIDWDLVMLIIGSVAQQVAYQRQPL